MRFLDLKDDLENGDNSIAAILKTVSLGADMRASSLVANSERRPLVATAFRKRKSWQTQRSQT